MIDGGVLEEPVMHSHSRAFSLIGMLVTVCCMAVLLVLLMQGIGGTIGSPGTPRAGTTRTLADSMALTGLYQSLFAWSTDRGGRFLVPSTLTGSGQVQEDTTAHLFSALIMHHSVNPRMLISANEPSPMVWEVEGYNYRAYDPSSHTWWDAEFKADLDRLSNVSYAHVPLAGRRMQTHWQAGAAGSLPILGNRGPENGDDPESWTVLPGGGWAGQVLFADGRISFLDSPVHGSLWRHEGGKRTADNLFQMETGPLGGDSILTFTQTMAPEGPTIQHD